MGAAAAAVLIRKEKEIVETYRSARATTPGAARDPDELRVHQHLAFRRLVSRAVLRESDGGRYYLDEPRWEALRSFRRRMAFVVIAVVLIVGAIVMLGGVAVLGGIAAHSASK